MKKIATLLMIATLFIGIPAAWAETWSVDYRGKLVNPSSAFSIGDTVGITAYILDQNVSEVSGAQVLLEIRDAEGNQITYLKGFTDANGYAVMIWKTSGRQLPGTYTAKLVNVIKSGYEFRPDISKTIVAFTIN